MRPIATVGGLGYLPVAPGTAGSLAGLAVSWFLSVGPWYQLAGCVVAIVLALWSAGPTAKAMGQADPSCIVIDEVAGMMTAVAALPAQWPVYLAGFLLFRFFDVVKPLGIRSLQRVPGSLGIVLDDLAAGLAAQAVMRLGLIFLG
ncbi:MAG: phosphatidylglycerophosphatase A [Candidatus Omnitrophica bacterium]|nr:phosphatidylglycerophosphatase A [Candidatus Omnitrophota bacterium]